MERRLETCRTRAESGEAMWKSTVFRFREPRTRRTNSHELRGFGSLKSRWVVRGDFNIIGGVFIIEG
jgi:hypothetical protein